MNINKLEDSADYGDARLGQLMVDRDAIQDQSSQVKSMFNAYVKVVKSLIGKMRSGTAEQLKRCAESSMNTKLMIKGKEPSMKKTEAIGEIFDKYAALIDELVAQIMMATRTRSKNRTRRSTKRRAFRP